MIRRGTLLALSLFGCCLSGAVSAQVVTSESTPSRFATSEPPELVALTNLGANPGVGAASFNVRQPNGQPTLHLGAIGLRGGYDVGITEKVLAIYVGGGIGRVNLDDGFVGTLNTGEQVRMETKKQVTSGGVLVGLDYRPWEPLHIRPEIATGFSRMTSHSVFSGLDPTPFLALRDARFPNWDLWALTIAPALDVSLDLTFGNHHRLELQGTWAHGFHRSFAESEKELHFSGYTNTVYGRSQFTSPMGLELLKIPLDWDVQFQITHFLTDETDPLGFSTVMAASGGIDFRFDRKIFLFPLHSAGPQIGVIFGPNISGFALGLSVRG